MKMFKIFQPKPLVLTLFLLITAPLVKAQDTSVVNEQARKQKAFAMVGYATLIYENTPHEESGFIGATFNPIFLYKVNEKISFNAELEIEVEDSWDGEIALEFAEFNYQLNNNIAFYGGKFLSPLGTFQDRYHPTWINKSINHPIGINNEVNGIKRLQGDSELGVGFRGGFHSGTARFNYNIYATNGPRLNDDGSVDFDNSGGDNNNSPAVGARLGFLHFQNSTFEIGVSAYEGKAGDDEAYGDTSVMLLVFDLNYVKQTTAGVFDIKSQFNDQKVSDQVFPETIIPNEDFNNNTYAYYVQLAFRPPNSNFELVNRFSGLNVPEEVTWGADQTRYTITLDYWLNWNTAIKVGYDFIENEENALGVSFAIGL